MTGPSAVLSPPAKGLVLERIDAWRCRIPRHGAMRTEGLVFADEALAADLRDDPALAQVANVASLPGIVGPSIAMPDVHWGYGFRSAVSRPSPPLRRRRLTRRRRYDINCGVRLMRRTWSAPSWNRA
jgi:tRNA-splicing ligase RtcB